MRFRKFYITEALHTIPVNMLIPQSLYSGSQADMQGEYSSSSFWKGFMSLSRDKQLSWAKGVDLSDPIDIRIDSDGDISFNDGHHRAMAAKVLGQDLSVNVENMYITDDKFKQLQSLYRSGLSSKQINPEGRRLSKLDLDGVASFYKDYGTNTHPYTDDDMLDKYIQYTRITDDN